MKPIAQFILLTALLAACAAPPVDRSPVISDDDCIPPGETFAYPVNPQDGIVSIPNVLPPAPWEVVQTPFYDENVSLVERDVLTSRTYNGQRELWLKNDRQITIYYPDSKTWKNVPATIGDSQIYIDKLFITQDNTVFGLPSWHYSMETTKFLLSKYNEATEQFEYAPGTQEILVPSSSRLGSFPHFVVLDAEKNIFWVLVTDDGIYSYNPQTEVSQKHLALPDVGEYTLLDVTFSPDGNIYYYAVKPGGSVTHQNSRLYRFEISTESISSTIIRLEPSQTSPSIFADHSGRVWYGALGWMEADGTWYQMVRSPLFITNVLWSGMEYRWKSPTIILESSDYRLWYVGIDNKGTVWLDPEAGKWCLFTSYKTNNIVEDQEQNLWAVFDGELYRYPLNP